MTPKQFKTLALLVALTIILVGVAVYLLVTSRPKDIEVHNYIGKSAYQIAIDNGFKGSESQWLETLKAEPVPGPKGDSIKGDKGDNAVSTHTEKIIEQQTVLEKQIPVNGQNGREIELRSNPDTKDLEWRYVGTRGWNVLLEYCELTKCEDGQ